MMVPVVHLHFHGRKTGVTRHVEDVAQGLPAEVAGWGLSPGFPVTGPRRLWRRTREGPVVLHAHRNLELLAALMLRAFSPVHVRVVFTRHSAGRPSRWTRWLARHADARVVLTRGGLRDFGLTAEVIPHGVDARAFAPPEDRRAAWSALEFGGSHGVGTVGRIRPSKGQEDLAVAFATLAPQHPGWRAVAVGRVGRPDRAYARRLEELGLLHLDEVHEVASIDRGLTIFVQPSRRESFSLVLLEAMAAGCCVVAAHQPHYPELIEHGRTGFLYPAGDVAALRAILAPLLADPARAESIGRAAAAAVREQWTLDRELRGLRSLYRQMERLG
jgi:mannosyltransferase